MPKWTATRPQANKEDMAPDDHMASTNDDGRGIVSFEITKKKPNKKAQSKKSKNKKNKGVAGGVAPGGAVPSGGGVQVDDGSEGVLIPSSKGKERADVRAVEMDEKMGRSGEGETDETVVKKKVVDRLSDKNRELVSVLPISITERNLLLTNSAYIRFFLLRPHWTFPRTHQASAKAQIAQKDKERKKRNKLERTGVAGPGDPTKTEGGEGKKKSVGFAM